MTPPLPFPNFLPFQTGSPIFAGIIPYFFKYSRIFFPELHPPQGFQTHESPQIYLGVLYLHMLYSRCGITVSVVHILIPAMDADLLRKRSDADRSGDRVTVVTGSMLGDHISLGRQRDLLDHRPVVQRFPSQSIGIVQFVFDDFIHLVGCKRLPRTLAVSRLRTEVSFFPRMLWLLRRLDEVARGWLGRIARVLFQSRILLFQLLDALKQRGNLSFQFGNRLIFFIHALGCTKTQGVAQVAYFNILEFSEKICER